MNYIIKSAIIGDYGVGKTSIVSRYTNDRFYEGEAPTLGVDFLHKEVDYKENKYKLQIWDTAGQEKFESIVRSYIRDLNACILVFDVNCNKTFQRVKKWLMDIEYIVENPVYICLVGSKTDLGLREVSDEDIKKFCTEHNLDYMECSAKKSENINSIFINLIEKIDSMVIKNEIILRSYGDFAIKPSYSDSRNIKEKCCLIS
jgi:small GTP-binding protein